MNVKLEWYEMVEAARVGVARNAACVMAGKKTDSAAPWEHHVEGACAEMAFAKLHGIFWSHSVNTFREEADVGIIQVRSTQHQDGHLILKEKDKDGELFVLMVGRSNKFRFAGWAYGYEVRERGQQRGCEFWLAQGLLHEPSTLPRVASPTEGEVSVPE